MPFDRIRSRRKSTKKATTKPLILVIDDDPSILRALEFKLKKKYNVRLCNSGKNGIERADENVDVVILDIKMPGKDGLQVYEEIRAKLPRLPIIFYSAYQNLLEESELLDKHKPFGYLDKGVDYEKLLERIEIRKCSFC